MYNRKSMWSENWRSGGKDQPQNNEPFPYRKYDLIYSLKSSLDFIFNANPVILNQKWTIPQGKIVNKIPNFNEIYYLSDTVVTAVPDHWNYDKIVDFYCEEARIKTPGYGEKYSLYDYWTNTNLHYRWNKNKSRIESKSYLPRELLYENIQEARPAYILVSKSLYAALIRLLDYESVSRYKILDIAAYGERAIAASSLNLDYDGVDPNYLLVSGHEQILVDLNCINPNSNIRFIHIGLEDFKSSSKYDIITYSPPPYNVELYGQGQQTQSYSKYSTFEDYICKFMLEIIYKANLYTKEGGIFSITALDRNPSVFKVKIDKDLISNHIELIYIELILLIISCLNFKYIGAIGLASGGKKAGVPWWTFKKDSYQTNDLLLLEKYYPDIFSVIGTRLLTFTNIHNKYKKIDINDNYLISKIQIGTKPICMDKLIIMELMRLRIQNYIVKTICNLIGIGHEKIRTILGRYLMLRSINATFDDPWKDGLYLDPVFPVNTDDTRQITDTVVNYLIEKGISSELSNNIVYKYKYWFGSYEVTGLDDLYNCVSHYMSSIPINGSYRIEKNKIILSKNTILCNQLMNSSDFVVNINSDIPILQYLRYETLGAHGHQFTRSNKRTLILEKIIGMPIIDLYASSYNNQSDIFCSIYPDIEGIGSAFCLKMLKGAYLANPVDIPIFIEKAINIIKSDLYDAKENGRELYISMAFTVWTDTDPDFINNFISRQSNLFINSKNIGLNMLAESEFILASYILDKNKFPSVLAGKEINRDNSISVGIILGTGQINTEHLIHLVKNDTYYVTN